MKRPRKPFLTVKVVPACVRESSLAAGRRDPHGSRVVPVVHDADRAHREAGGETLRESALPPRDREEKAVVLSTEEGEAHRVVADEPAELRQARVDGKPGKVQRSRDARGTTETVQVA
jgi:hypothetical protein